MFRDRDVKPGNEGGTRGRSRDDAAGTSPSGSASALLRLQRSHGNRYVQRMVASARTGGEVEASPEVQRAIEGSRGGGQALDSGVRRRMEAVLGTDFGGVRVHTDARADSLNRALSAKAFTAGGDIYFREQEHRPGTAAGEELLAHELTHVAQQGGRPAGGRMVIGDPDDAYEREADAVSRAYGQRQP